MTMTAPVTHRRTDAGSSAGTRWTERTDRWLQSIADGAIRVLFSVSRVRS